MMFIARDKDRHLYLFNDVPRRGTECWWSEKGVDGTYLRLEDSLYPEVTWDSEPLSVMLTVEVPGNRLP